MKREIAFGSDHAGLNLKDELIRFLKARGDDLQIEDVGTYSSASVDYPDFADKVVLKLKTNPGASGILVCGSGQGMAIRANRYPFIRAALCTTEEQARLAREHNDANILCLAGRFTPIHTAVAMLETFLKTPFAGGRHQARIQKLTDVPNC